MGWRDNFIKKWSFRIQQALSPRAFSFPGGIKPYGLKSLQCSECDFRLPCLTSEWVVGTRPSFSTLRFVASKHLTKLGRVPGEIAANGRLYAKLGNRVLSLLIVYYYSLHLQYIASFFGKVRSCINSPLPSFSQTTTHCARSVLQRQSV